MSQYERIGEMPEKFAITIRWSRATASGAAKRIFALPRIAPEVVRRVLDDAVSTGRFDEIVREIEREQEVGHDHPQEAGQG